MYVTSPVTLLILPESEDPASHVATAAAVGEAGEE